MGTSKLQKALLRVSLILLRSFLVMAGVGVGMSMGPLAIHCRFSQSEDRVAVVSALGLFVRVFPW